MMCPQAKREGKQLVRISEHLHEELPLSMLTLLQCPPCQKRLYRSYRSCGIGAVKDLPPASVYSYGKYFTANRISLQHEMRTADERG